MAGRCRDYGPRHPEVAHVSALVARRLCGDTLHTRFLADAPVYRAFLGGYQANVATVSVLKSGRRTWFGVSYHVARQRRDSGLQRLSAIDADLASFATAAADGYAIKIELSYGWLYAKRRSSKKVDVVVFGPGGGFCWRREMTRTGLRNRLQDGTPDDPRVQRGPASEVWPRD